MKKLNFTQYKGGSGKSTSAVQLASTAAVTHKMRTAVLDLDVQASAINWQLRRTSDWPKVFAGTPDSLETELQRLESTIELSIFDTPGHDWTAIAKAAVHADLTVLVGRPTQIDFEPAARVASALRQFRVPYVVLVTQAPHRQSSKLEAWMRAYSGLGRLVPVTLTYLQPFQDSMTLGLGVEEYEPNGRAAREVRAALAWILETLRGGQE